MSKEIAASSNFSIFKTQPSMMRHQSSALVQHSALDMFNLVKDVASYPEFLPWCQTTRILKQAPQELCAEITVSRLGITQVFATCNQYEAGQWMNIKLHNGPFHTLNGIWRFHSLRTNACKISLELEFAFSNILIEQAFGSVFHYATNSLVDAFCARANTIYSK
jgi:ribosome-associated toxin RatA of RatAB toxin-antitoxin module